MQLDLSSPNYQSYEFESAEALQAALVAAGLPKLDVPGAVIVDGRKIEARIWTHISPPPAYKLFVSPVDYTATVAIRGDQMEKLVALAAKMRQEQDTPVALEDVIESLIAGAPLDNASRRPVYEAMYIWCDDNTPGAIRVRHVSGDFEASLLKVSPDEIKPDDRIYVAIEHEVSYPYAAIDFIQIVAETPLVATRRKHNIQPRQFCEATLVATPKLHLIGGY